MAILRAEQRSDLLRSTAPPELPLRSSSFAFTAALALAACIGGSAWAQSYPSQPVTVISAFPSGHNDVIFRLVDGPFQAAFKQPLIIENRPGAGGNIAAEAVSRSAPDGHTLLVTLGTVATVNPHLYRNLKFKTDVDLVPAIYLVNSAKTLVCHSMAPVKSVSELVAYAQSHDMAYASGGQGVPGHLAAEMFLAATGLRKPVGFEGRLPEGCAGAAVAEPQRVESRHPHHSLFAPP